MARIGPGRWAMSGVPHPPPHQQLVQERDDEISECKRALLAAQRKDQEQQVFVLGGEKGAHFCCIQGLALTAFGIT